MSLATHGLPFTKLTKALPAPVLKELLIYYGYPISYKGLYDSSLIAAEISANYKYWVVGDSYSSPTHPEYATTTAIVTGVRTAGCKVFGYVPIGQSTQALTVAEIKTRIDEWVVVGVDGIFLDEFGFDYGNTRAKQIEIVDYVHSKGLPVCANSWVAEDFLADNISELPWGSNDWRYANFQNYNPSNLPLNRISKDFLLVENFCYDHTGPMNVFDVQERTTLTTALAATKKIGLWAVAVLGESSPGVANPALIGNFETLTEVSAYVAANAYIYGIDIVGVGGYSFGSAGQPINIPLPKLPSVATAATTPASSNYVTGIATRQFGSVTVSVRNMNGQATTVTTTASNSVTFDSITKTADLLVSPKKYDTATLAIADSSIRAGMLINASLTPNKDHDMDDLTNVRVLAHAVNGGVEFTLCTTGLLVGTYKVLYNKG